MSQYLRISFRLLDGTFHGRGDRNVPEWPPSPLRAFQALVAAAGNRCRSEAMFNEFAREPLAWLESLDPPFVVAAVRDLSSTSYRLFVPNNHADVVAGGWHGGDRFASIAEHRVHKDVRAARMIGSDTIHYLWSLSSVPTEYIRLLTVFVREVTHLGWGIDQAAASASLISADEAEKLSGERWMRDDIHGVGLRVPVPANEAIGEPGTLADLRAKHAAFLGRLGPKGFTPVPPLTAFRVVGYRNAAAPAGRPIAAFELLKPDTDEGGRLSRDPVRGTRDVAAWVRHAVAAVCKDWPHGDVEQFVHGHDGPDRPVKGDGADRRFQYLPLPTINPALGRVESIRRALVAAPPGCEPQIAWLKQRLSGQELKDGETVHGLLNRLPDGDWVRGQYTRASKGWATVTPVLLPGYDDRDRRRAERLLWKAFEDAGLSPEALTGAEAEWRAVGFRAGVEPAWRFDPPAELERWPRYHVRVRFARPVAGPLAVGAGRYRGFGLLVADGG